MKKVTHGSRIAWGILQIIVFMSSASSVMNFQKHDYPLGFMFSVLGVAFGMLACYFWNPLRDGFSDE